MKKRLTPTRIILLGFLGLILIGSIFLMLPISSYPDKNISFLDALFTATSASCVTGLLIYDTNTTWTVFGKIVILIMVQIGGLGIMSIFTIFSLLVKRELNLTERLTISETINEFNLSDIVKLFFNILSVTLFFEFVCTLIFFSQLASIYGNSSALFKSIFLSVSAFCNSGFEIFGTDIMPFQSLTNFNTNKIILLTISFLVIIGGLGFVVWKDIWKYKFNFKKYSLHTKIVLIMTIILILLGTIFIYIFEFNNTLRNMTFDNQLLNAFFSSVNARTAGFNSLESNSLTDETKFLTMIFMVIGGAPGSTAGGIKITTIAILILSAIFFIIGREDIQVMKKSISHNTIFKSVCIFMLALLIIFIATFIILIDNNIEFIDAFFEVTAAFSTTGLFTEITPLLNPLSKIVLMFCMFLGRLGPLTLVIAFSSKQTFNKPCYKYSEGKIAVG